MNLTKEQKVMQQVISKAWNDPAFKLELIKNPIQAIEKLTGESIAIPDGKTLTVFDQSNPNVICLNIPPEPNLDNVALTDDQLEVVAGGGYPWQIIQGCFPTFPTIPIIVKPLPTVPKITF